MTIKSIKLLTAVATALLFCVSDAFLHPGLQKINLKHFNDNVSRNPHARSQQTRAASQLQMSTASAMDRLSDSTISAINFSQSASRSIGVASLENEMLTVGMIQSAGADDMEARKILSSFGIFPDGARQAAESVLILKGLGKRGGGTLGDAPLPFSDGVKKTLDVAVSIAERMSGSREGVVMPGHVLLALLEYDERYHVATEDATKCGGLAVLQKTVEDTMVNFDGTKFCRALAEYMKTQAALESSTNGSTTEIREREVIVVGGKTTGSTPTLDKVGIDLTEMAREGRLDAVYGREKEIRMCLRTLGRRRKSNPW